MISRQGSSQQGGMCKRGCGHRKPGRSCPRSGTLCRAIEPTWLGMLPSHVSRDEASSLVGDVSVYAVHF